MPSTFGAVMGDFLARANLIQNLLRRLLKNHDPHDVSIATVVANRS